LLLLFYLLDIVTTCLNERLHNECHVLQSLTEDVARQMERERELQKRFAELQQQKDDLSELLNQ